IRGIIVERREGDRLPLIPGRQPEVDHLGRRPIAQLVELTGRVAWRTGRAQGILGRVADAEAEIQPVVTVAAPEVGRVPETTRARTRRFVAVAPHTRGLQPGERVGV